MRSDSGRRRPGRLAVFGCLLTPLLICGVGGFVLTWQINRTANKLPVHLAELRKLGVATEPADLQPVPRINDSENAADIYRSIGAHLNELEGSRAGVEVIKLLDGFAGPSGNSADLPKVVAAVKKQQAIFNSAEELMDRPGLDFRRDYNQGFALLFPEFADQKRLAKWLCSRSKAQWLVGDRRAAIQTLRISYRVGEHIQQESFLIANLVYTAVQAINHNTLYTFMVDARNDRKTLAELEAMRRSVLPAPDFRKALGGEWVLGRVGIASLRGPSSIAALGAAGGDPNSEPPHWVDLLLGNERVRRMYEAKYAEAWLKLFRRLPDDRTDWIGTSYSLRVVVDDIDKDKSIENILNRILFPILNQAADAAASRAAEQQMERLSFLLLHSRVKGLPNNLSGFGDLARDPFAAKPFGYLRLGNGFKIWSVGPDRVDQGGVKRKRGGNGTHGYDLVMAFDMPIAEASPQRAPSRFSGHTRP